MMVPVFAYESEDGDYILHTCVDHGGSAVLGEPCEDLIQAYCAVSLKIQFHSYRLMLAMMDDSQAA